MRLNYHFTRHRSLYTRMTCTRLLQLTLFICAASALYCLLSAAVVLVVDDSSNTLSSRITDTNAIRVSWTAATSLGQQRSPPTDVNCSVPPADQYDHYSARLSRRSVVAKDALGEMKFLRRGVEAAKPPTPPPLDGRVPPDRRSGGSGLTSLSAAVPDNHQLPVPRGGRPQSAKDREIYHCRHSVR